MLGSLLLSGGAGKRDGLGLGGEALLLLLVLARHEDDGAKADDEGAGKDDGDDDAGDVEILADHADIVVARVDGADHGGSTLADGGIGRGAVSGGRLAGAVGGDGAVGRGLCRRGEAGVSGLDGAGLGRGGRVSRRVGTGGEAGDIGVDPGDHGNALEALAEVARILLLLAAAEDDAVLVVGLGAGAAATGVAGLDARGVKLLELCEALADDALVAAVSERGKLLTVLHEAVDGREGQDVATGHGEERGSAGKTHIVVLCLYYSRTRAREGGRGEGRSP